jgi:hypothetical protein
MESIIPCFFIFITIQNRFNKYAALAVTFIKNLFSQHGKKFNPPAAN